MSQRRDDHPGDGREAAAAASPDPRRRGSGPGHRPTSIITGFVRSLLAEGRITEGQLRDAQALRTGSKRSLLQCLIDLDFIDEESLLDLLEAESGLARVALAPEQVDPALVERVPYRIARTRFALPVCRRDPDPVLVALADPTDLLALDDLAACVGAAVQPMLVAPSHLDRAIAEVYRPGDAEVFHLVDRFRDDDRRASGLSGAVMRPDLRGDPGSASGAFARPEARPVDPEETEAVARAPIVRLGNLILRDAIRQRASDVHVEPSEEGILVRFRIDGVLRDIQSLSRGIGEPLISRLKVMAAMDITITRKPQDARARIRVDGRVVDLRVSTLPTLYGEKLVLRILDPQNLILDLAGLFGPQDLERFESLLLRPQGLLLVTGPTGSGKTTTLYSALARLESRALNLVTIEDPVEYRLRGVNQVEVSAELGFASALRSVLRQDPNVVLVGEIRDAETAEIALRAAMTGHLVLSTLHTNDAAATLMRLRDLGIDAALIGQALTGVVAQRLARRLCPACREPYQAGADEVASVSPALAGATLYRARGCAVCDYQGLRGRVAAYEILPLTAEVRGLIGRGLADQPFREALRKSGVTSMFDAGIRLALAGETTLDEVARVVPRDPSADDLRCAACGEVLERGFLFCPQCSREVSTACAGCRQPLRMGWRFCAACGIEVPRPAAPAPLAAAPAGTAAARATGRHGAAAAAAAAGPTVLVADDAWDARRVVRAMLEKAGFRVREAATGEDALREVAAARPDALLLDLELPGMNGFDVCRRLRERLETAGLPIVMLTGFDEAGTEGAALDAGADDYLTKPVRYEVLTQRLRMALERARAGSAAG